MSPGAQKLIPSQDTLLTRIGYAESLLRSQDHLIRVAKWLRLGLLVLSFFSADFLGAQTESELLTGGIEKFEAADYHGAIADFSRVIELRPSNATLYHVRGLARMTTQVSDYHGAIADFTRVLELDPSNADAYHNRGLVNLILEHYSDAISDYTRLIELRPNLAEGYRERGVAKRGAGNLDGALADLSRAMRLAPDDAVVWRERGLVLYMKDDFQGALSDLDRSVQLDEGDQITLFQRGEVRRSAGDYPGAIQDFNRVIALNDEASHAHEALGLTQEMVGSFGAAAASYLAGTRNRSGASALSQFQLHLTLRRLGRGAEDDFGRHLPAPDGSWTHKISALLLGRSDIQELMRFIDSAPLSRERGRMRCEAHYYAGMVNLLNDRKAEAMREFQAATEQGNARWPQWHLAKAELARMSPP